LTRCRTSWGNGSPALRAQTEASNLKGEAQAKAFEAGLPTARVARIPRTNHDVFLSNEADVLREMDTLITAPSR
jgi:hypothetical protein